MWAKIAAWLRWVFLKPRPEAEVIPEYAVPSEWIFPGPRPTNMVIHKLYQNMETIGDHIMYRSHETGRLGGTIWDGEQSWLVKQLTFWIAGGTLHPGHTFNTVRSTCGSQRCARPDHLKIKYNPSKQEKPRAKKDTPKINVNRVSGPPEYVAESKEPSRSIGEVLGGDRTKCVSGKVFHDTVEIAVALAKEYNEEHRPKGGPRLYGYDCDWCAGAHFTSQNPATRPKYKHKGSWS